MLCLSEHLAMPVKPGPFSSGQVFFLCATSTELFWPTACQFIQKLCHNHTRSSLSEENRKNRSMSYGKLHKMLSVFIFLGLDVSYLASQMAYMFQHMHWFPWFWQFRVFKIKMIFMLTITTSSKNALNVLQLISARLQYFSASFNMSPAQH